MLPIDYSKKPVRLISTGAGEIASFITGEKGNIDGNTVRSFGEEWLKFNSFSEQDISSAGAQYFDVVGEADLTKNFYVLDAGCGSGRWTKYISERAGFIEAIDPSNAVLSAYHLNKNAGNVRVTQAEIGNIPFADETFDFVLCLGVLHHIPDTQKALCDIVQKMKKNAGILIYIYYSLDGRGLLYKTIFRLSHYIRLLISSLPPSLKKPLCDLIAASVYLPLVMLVRSLRIAFRERKWIRKMPLSYYERKSFRIMRNDALDRFGTPLEKRFSRRQIEEMMKKAGLVNIKFSDAEPFWHVLGKKQ